MNLPRLVLADDHTDTRNQMACLLEQEFDVTACGEIPSDAKGPRTIGHAVSFVYRRVLKDDPIPLVPIFTPYLALLLLFFNRVIPGILLLLAAAFMSPVALARPVAVHLPGHDWYSATHRSPLILLVMIVLAAAFAILLILELVGVGFAAFARTAGAVACIVLIPFVMSLVPFPLSHEFYTDVIKQPWLPAEVITLTSGQRSIGYVLSDNGTWLVVLGDGARTIHYYRSPQVASQQICQIVHALPGPQLIPVFPAHLKSATSTPVCAALLIGPSR